VGQHAENDLATEPIRSLLGAFIRRVSAFVSRARQSLQRVSASKVESLPPRDDAREKAILAEAKAYYAAHRDELLRQFGENCFLAIRSEKIVDFDGDFAQLARRISSKFPGQAVYVVNTAEEPQQRIVHIDSPEVV
jgi:chorismate mutase